jgi:hypothetical protein
MTTKPRPVIRIVDARRFHTVLHKHIADESHRLPAEFHHEDCPVRHGASIDCVWPMAICVSEEFIKHIK